ncbi:MAG TPA: hypothetical protein VKS78_02680 [Roseiarcus sp.]|nr:hypothetical protein [Roseiarcus sp.]
MSAWEIVFLVLVAGGFLGFVAAVGGLQWHLSRKPKERPRSSSPTGKMFDASVAR